MQMDSSSPLIPPAQTRLYSLVLASARNRAKGLGTAFSYRDNYYWSEQGEAKADFCEESGRRSVLLRAHVYFAGRCVMTRD
jgi:hypothetical protein